MIVESDWVLAHQWAEKAGLDVIACISPDENGRKAIEGAVEDAMEIISFSDHMGFNANWQLGYGKLISKHLEKVYLQFFKLDFFQNPKLDAI